MTARVPVASRDAAVDGVAPLANGGKLRLYTGTQPGAASDAPTGTLLVEWDLAATAFGASSSGAAALAGTPISAVAGATGVAGWFRIVGSGSATVYDGAVGEELTLDNTNIASGQTVNLNSWSLTLPASE